MSTYQSSPEGETSTGSGVDSSLLDLLGALVNEWGRVAAAEALGMNYRTMMACYDSRQVSRRMRQELADFRDSGGADEVGDDVDTGPEFGDGTGGADGESKSLEQRLAPLEGKHSGDQGLVVVNHQPPAWRPPRRGCRTPGS